MNLPIKINEIAQNPNEVTLVLEKLQTAKNIARLCQIEALEYFSYEQASLHEVLPVSRSESFGDVVVSVLCTKKFINDSLKEFEFLHDIRFEAELIDESLLRDSIEIAYKASSNWLVSCVKEMEVALPVKKKKEESLFVSHSSAPMLLDAILNRAINLEASDIHLEASGNKIMLRFRVDGELFEEDLDASELSLPHISRRIKVLSGIDPLITKQTIDCSFDYSYLSFNYRIRASLIPLISSEKIVLRVLKPKEAEQMLSYADMGLLKEQEEQLLFFLRRKSGVLLLSGPTGSGKTTLLYKALRELNDTKKNICTIEDPVEQVIAGLSQAQVNKESNLGFYQLLVAILRQDPDVIMLGEIRESETANAALVAGITGHLVLSTVHAANAVEVFSRLLQLGVSAELISQALSLIISQRLIPQNCKNCIREVAVEKDLSNFFVLEKGKTLYESFGCLECNNTGIKGRVGVYEFFPINNYVREVIEGVELKEDSQGQSNAFSARIRRAGISSGYLPYQLRVRELLLNGVISPRQAVSYL